MALFYADASALVKLVRDEPESAALRAFIADADLASCDLVLAEVPRAIRRAAALDQTAGPRGADGPRGRGPRSACARPP